nr:putative capsid protein [Cressdnaviricota sp.]
MTSVAVSTADSVPRTVYRTRARPRRMPARRRRPTTRRRRTIRPRIQRSVQPRMSKFVLANIDPFNQNADGAKVPDANTYPSTPLRAEDELTQTTDATYGVTVSAFRPYVTSYRIGGTAAGSSSWTWPASYGGGTNSTRQSSVVANYELVRPVAHGIRIYCPAAATTITGFVHVCVYAQNFSGTTWSYPTNVAQMNNCMFYQRYPLSMLTQKAVTVVNKFLDTSATRYVDPSSDIAAQETDTSFHSEGWGTIIVAVESAPVSTASITVEHVIHLEALPLATGINSASAAAPYNIASLETVSRVAGHTPASFVQGEEQGYLAQAASAIGQGAYSVLGQAIPRFGYAVGRYAAGRGLQYVGRGLSGITDARLQSGFRGGLNRIGNGMY